MELRSLVVWLFIFLTGCTASQTENKKLFEVDIPLEASYETVRQDKSVAYSTYSPPISRYKESDYFIEIYPSKSLGASVSCGHKQLGASNLEFLFKGNNEIYWGKVDFPYDYSLTELKPDCRPYRGISTSYVLCSQKDGKTVVICVNQQTDNPELAKEIFESFRWLEDK